MANPASRKSTKKCPRGKIARRSHVRMGRKIKSTCVRKPRVRNTRRTVDRSRVVAMFYPDRAPVTIGDLMNMYSKTRFIEAVNDPIEPEERAEKGFGSDQTFTQIVERLMTFGDATIDITPDKRPFPEGQSRIVFMNA
jgi:hypothetical protein